MILAVALPTCVIAPLSEDYAMLPSTASRVACNTATSVNKQIQRQTEENVRRFAQAPSGSIDRRLGELDEEWDIERYLETMAPTFTLFGIGMGLNCNRKWFALPLAV